MRKIRKIFFVVASGGHGTDKHYYDTIERKRTLEELSPFLDSKDSAILKENYHSGPFALWGAVPGSGNLRTWDVMEPGDYVLIYKSGKVIFAAEVALKTKNPKLAEYLWNKDQNGQTWEYLYFLVNPEQVSVEMSNLNKYLGYSDNYFPRGFMSIDQTKVNNLLGSYGDILSALRKIEKGKELEKINPKLKEELVQIDENIERATTKHDEMQWRLIKLGKRINVDVWIPKSDQNKTYNGQHFKENVLNDFQETLDVPPYIKNIDVVWKYGYSIKSAFEIEHSTSVYSGILRLSDLRALTPNSNYPLFIVADRARKNKVFSELKRPTFDNPYLNLKEVINFLSYDKIREIDEGIKYDNFNITLDYVVTNSERIS